MDNAQIPQIPQIPGSPAWAALALGAPAALAAVHGLAQVPGVAVALLAASVGALVTLRRAWRVRPGGT